MALPGIELRSHKTQIATVTKRYFASHFLYTHDRYRVSLDFTPTNCALHLSDQLRILTRQQAQFLAAQLP